MVALASTEEGQNLAGENVAGRVNLETVVCGY